MNFRPSAGGIAWRGLTPAVRVLLRLNVVMFLLMILVDGHTHGGGAGSGWITAHLGLRPEDVLAGAWWQLATYMFLHSGYLLWHVVMNMVGLVLIGPETEHSMGTRRFVVMYLLSGLLGGAAQVFAGEPGVPVVGASGALMGVLGAFVALYPRARVMLIFLPFWPIRAWIIGLAVLLMQVVPILFNHQSNVAYWVHLGGGLAGFFYTMVLMVPGRLNSRRGGMLEPRSASPVSGTDLARADRILEKLHAEGREALSAKEWAILEDARARFQPPPSP